MELEEYEDNIEKEELSLFFDKKEASGQTVAFNIEAVKKWRKKMTLEVSSDRYEGTKLLKVTFDLKNRLIERYGTRKQDWINKTLTLKFFPFKANTDDMSDGYTYELVD